MTIEHDDNGVSRISDLVDILARAHFGEDAGFVVLLTYPRSGGREGSTVHVVTNLCHEHAAQTMVNIGSDYAKRHGVTIERMPFDDAPLQA